MWEPSKITGLLDRWRRGDSSAFDAIVEETYEELRQIASIHFARESPGHTLQPTAVVHTVYLRLSKQRNIPLDRQHFLALAARLVRFVLANHARGKNAQRSHKRVTLSVADALADQSGNHFDVGVLDLERALLTLEKEDEQAKDVVVLRYFGGLTIKETAAELGLSVASVKRRWAWARARLFELLEGLERD